MNKISKYIIQGNRMKCPFCLTQILKPTGVNRYNVILMRYSNSKKSLVSNEKVNDSSSLQTTVKSIKETTKTMSYLTILLAGFGVGAFVIYTILNELFSSKSPNTVYSKAFKYVSKHPRVTDNLGDKIKGFGEENRRGRRQRISNIKYKRGDADCLRMKFYIKGNRGSGTVYLEMVENEKRKYVYRYLFVIIDGLMQNVITLEDNRHLFPNVSQPPPKNFEELNLNESLDFSK